MNGADGVLAPDGVEQSKGERSVESYQGRTVVCDAASATTRARLNANDSAVADQFCRRVGKVPSERRSPPSLWPDGKGITFDLGTTVNGVEVWCSCMLSG